MERFAWVLVWALCAVPTGIAAEILFQEDFEDANLASRGWYDIASWGNELRLSTTEKRSGNAALEHRYAAGSTGAGWMRHQFPGQDRIYTRYYRRWQLGWLWPDPTLTGPHDTLLFAMYGERFFAPTQTYATVYTDSIQLRPSPRQPGTIGLQTRRIMQGEDYIHRQPIGLPVLPFNPAQWYCIETMVTMNTPGSSNGRIQIWVDGVARYDLTLELRNSANSKLQWDLFMWGPYFHGGTPQAQSTWIDALVVATERVGCLDDRKPKPPADLRVMP